MPENDEQSSREKEFLEFQRSVGQQNFGDPRASQEMNRQLKETVSKVKEVAEAFGQLSARMIGIKDSVEDASDTVSKRVEKTASQIRMSVKEMNGEITKAFSSFTAGGQEAVKATGPIGTAFDFVSKSLHEIPGGAALVVVALAAIYGNIVDLENKARTLRIGLTFAQFGMDIQATAGVVEPAIARLGSQWNLGREGAEKFIISLSAIAGPKALGMDTSKGLVSITDRVMQLKESFGVSKEAVTDMYARLRIGGDLSTDTFKEMDTATVKIYHSMQLSKLGVNGFTTALFGGVEQLRMFGAESATISKAAAGLGNFVANFSKGMIGGATGAVGAFKGVMGIAGSIMSDPALSLFIYGEGVGGRHPFQQLISAEGRMRERGGLGVFVDYINKLKSGGYKEDDIGMLLTPKLGAIASGILLKNLDKLGRYSSISEAQKAGVLSVADAMKLAEGATPPMERLRIITEEFMKTFMPAFSGTVVGLLQFVVNGVLALILHVSALPDRIFGNVTSRTVAADAATKSAWEAYGKAQTGMKTMVATSLEFARGVNKVLGISKAAVNPFENILTMKQVKEGDVGSTGGRNLSSSIAPSITNSLFKTLFGDAVDAAALIRKYMFKGTSEAGAAELPGSSQGNPRAAMDRMEAGGAPSYMVDKSFIGGNLVITITPQEARTLAYGR